MTGTRAPSAPRGERRSPRVGAAEAVALGAIVAVGIAVRMAGYGATHMPRWYFGMTPVASAHAALARGGLLGQWAALLTKTQANWAHESAVVMPVYAALEAAVGPSLRLPQLAGTLWAALALVLAWRVGRSLHSARMGLLFAAFLAASPLQITWARLGGFESASVTHVLLVAWLAIAAGRRPTAPALLGLTVALVSTLYHYYAARGALALAPVAALAGVRRGGSRRVGARRTAALAAILVLLAVAGWRWGHLWPRYHGYLGWDHPDDPGALARQAATNVARETPRILRAYFWSGRAYGGAYGVVSGTLAPPWSPDVAAGGLALVPVALLGAAGLVVALRGWRRHVFWLAVVAGGFLIPALSVTTARRLLVLDLGWCALAALALAAVVDTHARRRRGATVALAAVLGMAAYAGAVVVYLGRQLPSTYGAVIPFGDSGFGDGVTCIGCVERAARWEDTIRDGGFVVLFDADDDRESRTSPGGLRLYGQIAAAAAGHGDRWVDFYALMRNWDADPPRFGPLFDGARTEFLGELARRLRAAAPADVVWHFAQPTQWERALADRLVAAGGTFRPATAPPLGAGERRSPDPGFEVVTPWRRRAKALHRLAAFVEPGPRGRAATLVHEARIPVARLPVVFASEMGPGAPAGELPAYAGWYDLVAGDVSVAYERAVALARSGGVLHVMDRTGRPTVIRPPGGAPVVVGAPASTPVGNGCAAMAGGAWWIVDPVAGTLQRAGAAGAPPRPRRAARRYRAHRRPTSRARVRRADPAHRGRGHGHDPRRVPGVRAAPRPLALRGLHAARRGRRVARDVRRAHGAARVVRPARATARPLFLRPPARHRPAHDDGARRTGRGAAGRDAGAGCPRFPGVPRGRRGRAMKRGLHVHRRRRTKEA
jgi:hypothetical protein